MSEPMTQQFVTAFLTTCFDAGLSKEAAAELLQKESVDVELRRRPAFAEGYLKQASMFPGQLCPALRVRSASSEMEKAALLKGLGRAGKALLWDAPAGIAQSLFGAGKGVAKGVGRTFGPQKASLLERYPFTVGMAGMAGVGAGTYGLTKWLNQDNGLGANSNDPFLPPGGYSKAQYDAMYENRLKEHEPGIFSTNKEYDSSAGRIAELQKEIEEGRGGSNAYQELQQLERRRGSLGGARSDYTEQLDMNQDSSRDLMSRIANRTADLENQRTAWWAAPKRWLMQARGGDLFDSSISQRHFDRQIGGLQDNSARARMQERLAADRAKLVRGGATGRSAPQRTQEQLTTDFFPAY